MSNNIKVLVCYNEPVRAYENYIGKKCNSSEEDIDLSESEVSDHINDIVSHLRLYYKNVESCVFNSDIEETITRITSFSPDAIFNFVESVDGKANFEAYAAGLYELMGYHYTGNSPLALATCLDKSRTKQILNSFGIKSPNFMIARYKEKIKPDQFSLKFPVILKLLNEDASIGISELSVVNSFEEVNQRLSFLFRVYRQNVLIEEYINGRELNVSVLGGKVLPISEISFDGLPKGLPKIVTYEGKWSPESVYYKYTNPVCPAELDDELRQKVEETAKKAFEIMNCRDYARIDIRLSRNNVPYVIEVNPNPDLSTDAGFARASAAAGMTYAELLYTISNFALERKDHDKKVKA
ncbi:MAG: D-alanine--D-alanine ligase family protein [Bacillota bacterium]